MHIHQVAAVFAAIDDVSVLGSRYDVSEGSRTEMVPHCSLFSLSLSFFSVISLSFLCQISLSNFSHMFLSFFTGGGARRCLTERPPGAILRAVSVTFDSLYRLSSSFSVYFRPISGLKTLAHSLSIWHQDAHESNSSALEISFIADGASFCHYFRTLNKKMQNLPLISVILTQKVLK